MKAKNCLNGLLWRIIKHLVQLKYLLFHSLRSENSSQNCELPELNDVHAETERITQKLQETLARLERCKLENKNQGIMQLPVIKPGPKKKITSQYDAAGARMKNRTGSLTDNARQPST